VEQAFPFLDSAEGFQTTLRQVLEIVLLAGGLHRLTEAVGARERQFALVFHELEILESKPLEPQRGLKFLVRTTQSVSEGSEKRIQSPADEALCSTGQIPMIWSL